MSKTEFDVFCPDCNMLVARKGCATNYASRVGEANHWQCCRGRSERLDGQVLQKKVPSWKFCRMSRSRSVECKPIPRWTNRASFGGLYRVLSTRILGREASWRARKES
jgi:hypothetical protein